MKAVDSSSASAEEKTQNNRARQNGFFIAVSFSLSTSYSGISKNILIRNRIKKVKRQGQPKGLMGKIKIIKLLIIYKASQLGSLGAAA